MRVAALDLGTNSTRLLVADVHDGRVTEVARRLEITRLGEGVDERPVLQPGAIARVRRAVDGFHREARELGAEKMLATATSAVRDADNGAAFLADLAREYDLTTQMLSGADEARLTLAGITSDRELEPETLVVDIGGGSTELTVGGPEGVAFSTSLQLGCVRLTERFLASDPPGADELEACAAEVEAQLPDLSPARALGVAGTITTLAAIDLGIAEHDVSRTHGHVVSRSSVSRELARLEAMPVAQREQVPGLEPARAPVIVAGIIVLREILDRYELEEIEARERDILHGIALAAAAG